MRLLKLAALATLLSIALSACATDCGDVLVRWDYACKRRYQLCTINGHDEAYCRQVIENCWMDSRYVRADCSPPPEESQ
jgi:hypothetical protein